MWETRYSTDEYVYGTHPNHFLRERHPAIDGRRVLCVAEGEGRNAVFLATQGFEVTSFDLTHAGVAKTRRLAEQHQVHVDARVADAATFDLGDGQWDAIVSIFAHMPPPLRSDLHGRMVRALRPGGVVLLEAYTPAQIGRGTGGPQAAEMTMTLDGLHTELAGLVFEHGEELVRSVVEGAGHTGDGAVVQVVARKPAGTSGAE